ncbi:hypothetical protein P261_01282 [Lachnospiraceae bacterium TWA4]|nr:hypothetical protein P261_01282 [Lachnospiraceae bacterium TWA4]
MKKLKILSLILAILILFVGCTGGTVKTSDLTKLEQATSSETISQSNELPSDGIVSQSQMEAMSGKDATYSFSSTDEASKIKYTWLYEGKKIQNAIEQNLKVTILTEIPKTIEEKSKNVLGFQLEKINLAAPAKLQVELPNAWDCNTIEVYKLTDNHSELISDDGTIKDKTITISVTETGKDFYIVGTTSDKKEETVNNSAHTCVLAIDCKTILNNKDDLNEAKADFVPADGWILKRETVEYESGETVYDLLYRICKDRGIHMEASFTPIYSTYYVEGINQLYEFDCGSNSGWMYKVNGWYPNYGCSKYEISDGDVIEWRYTCELGHDVGDTYYEN